MRLALRYNFNEPDKTGLWLSSMNVSGILHKMKSYGVVYGEIVDSYLDEIDISLSRVSHTIDNINILNDYVEVEVRLLNTHWGNELKSAYNDGIPLCICPRLHGYIRDDNEVFVKELLTFDISYENYINVYEEDKMRTIRIRKNKLKKIEKICNIGS